jgi:hypothetical protein
MTYAITAAPVGKHVFFERQLFVFRGINFWAKINSHNPVKILFHDGKSRIPCPRRKTNQSRTSIGWARQRVVKGRLRVLARSGCFSFHLSMRRLGLGSELSEQPFSNVDSLRVSVSNFVAKHGPVALP